eukprot:1154234-Pelagomonas_calceolata.AAC.4
MQLIVVWNLNAREALDSAKKIGSNSSIKMYPKPTGYPFNMHLMPYHCIHTRPNIKQLEIKSPIPSPRHPYLLTQVPTGKAAFHPAAYEKTFTYKFKRWREITFTDGSVIQHKDDSPPLVGSGVYKSSRATSHSSKQLQCT